MFLVPYWLTATTRNRCAKSAAGSSVREFNGHAECIDHGIVRPATTYVIMMTSAAEVYRLTLYKSRAATVFAQKNVTQ